MENAAMEGFWEHFMADKQELSLLVLTVLMSLSTNILFRKSLSRRLSIQKTYQLKRLTKVLISVAVLSVTSVGTVNAITVVGTKHDLTVNANIVGGLGACGYCHGAHDSSDGQLALWKRTGATSTFALYSSPTINATV